MTNSDAQPAVLPEYQDNPFIAALPPLWSTKETYDRLLLQPVFDPRERQFPDHVRPHCIMRLFRYFDPLGVVSENGKNRTLSRLQWS